MAFPWSDEAEALAQRLYAIEGRSASEVALILGHGCTRSAVIGKAHRKGWTKEHRQQPTMAAVRAPRPPKALKPPKPPKAPREPRRAMIPSMGKAPVIVGVDYKLTAATAAQREACRKSGLSFVDRVETGAGVESPNARPFIESSGCKWPLDGGMVCCNRVARGVYCAGHAEVAYVGPGSDKTSAGVLRTINRTERIELTDLRYVHGQSGPRPMRDAAAPTPWDSARAAA